MCLYQREQRQDGERESVCVCDRHKERKNVYKIARERENVCVKQRENVCVK